MEIFITVFVIIYIIDIIASYTMAYEAWDDGEIETKKDFIVALIPGAWLLLVIYRIYKELK